MNFSIDQYYKSLSIYFCCLFVYYNLSFLPHMEIYIDNAGELDEFAKFILDSDAEGDENKNF